MNNHLKILMVEDDPFDAELVQRVLKKENLKADFYCVSDRESYLQALSNFQPDLVLSDNSLPQFNGTEALKLLRGQSDSIPFILITGTVSEEFAANMIKLGADDYILKDRLIRLPSSIDTALKHRKTEKDKVDATAMLVESEEKYRTLIERVSDAFIAVDMDWKYIYLNKQAGELFHRDPKEMIGKNMWEEFPESVGSETYKSFLKAMEDQQFTSSTDYYAPLELWQENYIYPSPEGLSVFIRDISSKMKTETALKQMEKQIQDQQIQEQKKIARAIINAQEKERDHIGQELHDNVNQLLAGAKMHLSIAGKKSAAIKEAVKFPMEVIDHSIREIRALASREVTPIKNIDLEELTGGLLEQLCNNTILKASFNYDIGEIIIGDELKVNIYRILQEQLNNIVNHAQASNVTVSITVAESHIKVLVEDDGKGFDVSKKRNGIGISNIMNRVESFNGALQIDSSPGQGCRIKINIPY